MATRVVTIIIFIGILFISCKSDARKFLSLSSIDNKQSIRVKMDKMKIYKNRKLDNRAIMSEMQAYKFDIYKLDEYLIQSLENNFVFYAENMIDAKEGEIKVFLFGSYELGLKELYYIEHEQGKWFWKLNSGNVHIQENKDFEIEIVVKLESINFALSGLIDFPLNEAGGYDLEKRYLNLNGKWDIDING